MRRVRQHPTRPELLGAASLDRTLSLFRLDGTVDILHDAREPACSLAFSPFNSYLLVVATDAGSLKYFKITEGDLVQTKRFDIQR